MFPPPPKPLTEDAFGVIVEHGHPRGSLKFMSTGGLAQAPLKELVLSLQVAFTEVGMISVGLTEGIKEEVKKIEFIDAYQSTMGALKRARELHKQLEEENNKLIEQNKRVENSSRFYPADTPIDTSFAPVTGCEGNNNEEVEGEENIADPNDTSANS
ncbi:Myocilin [Gossypium australe]|uniref:Myocilin n=1 Tax=Gossypium australe TaxID=47621 RepID=A0A5B6UGU7_9ROSI|nr:Myocilin [Gossypium australe]